MRFYLDENLSQQIAVIARSLGVDVTSAQELGRRGLSDDEQLALATSMNRCIVTRDYEDFSRLAGEAVERGIPHGGIVYVSRSLPTRRFAMLAHALYRFDQGHPNGLYPFETGWLT